MSETQKPRLLVDLVTDIVCPWCYVGLKSWQRAADELARDFEIITRYRPYELNQGVPVEGTDREAHYDRKFPDREKRKAMMQHLVNAAENVGAPFDPTLPKWLPNTLRAHRVLRWAHFEGLHDQLAERLYKAFWLEGADIGASENLADLAASTGLDREKILADLESGRDEKDVLQEAEAFRQAGVRGVPTFIINERHGFSGALPPQELEERMRQAATLNAA